VIGRKKIIAAIVACLSGTICFAAASAQAQTTASAAPNPPTEICVNNKCVATAAPAPIAAKGSIKWNPGHYMASEGVLYHGGTLASLQSEMDDLNNQDAILGYRVWVTWGLLESTQGNYDFSVLDAVLLVLTLSFF